MLRFKQILYFLTLLLTVYGGSIDVEDGLFSASWFINEGPGGVKALYVSLTARTTGYIGFGVGPFANMTDADLLICGFSAENGTRYGFDMHGVDNGLPELDAQQDYLLGAVIENVTHTFVDTVRLLDTMDPDDVEITDSLQFVLWSVGETDNLEHHSRRGVLEINFLAEYNNKI